MTFQCDLKETFIKIHNKYIDNFNDFINKDELLASLTLESAALVVSKLQEFNSSIEDIISILTNKEIPEIECTREEKITKELEQKIIPIMILYRQVLELKHQK